VLCDEDPGLLAVCAALALVSPRAFAQSDDTLTKAQASFDQAQQDYMQGKYDEAAQGFQAYAARRFPQFLYNVAASFHMKGKQTSDVEAYKKAASSTGAIWRRTRRPAIARRSRRRSACSMPRSSD
jgi:TolA-binding protein